MKKNSSYLMRRILPFIFWAFALFQMFSSVPTTFAQSENNNSAVDTEAGSNFVPEFEAVLEMDGTVEIGKKIIFDASKSINTYPDTETIFFWDLGDGTKAEGQEAVHTYDSAGEYTIKLFISNGIEDATLERKLFVYERSYVLLVDSAQKLQEIESSIQDARVKGVSFVIIAPEQEEKGLVSLSADYYVQLLLQKTESIKDIDVLLLWTDGILGVNILSSFAQSTKNADLYSFEDKEVVLITDYDLNIFSRVSSRSFQIINSHQMVLVYQNIFGVLHSLVNTPDFETFQETIQRNLPVNILSSETAGGGIFSMFSNSINSAIARGIPPDIIIFILLIPLISTIIAFLKQVVGMSTFGVYTPLILTLSLLVLGLGRGLIVLLVIIAGASMVKVILQKIRLHFIPRVAFILSFSSIILLFFFIIGSMLDFSFGWEKTVASNVTLNIFPMIILVMLAERFARIHIDAGFKKATFMLMEMVVVSIIAYLIANNEGVTLFLFAYPEIVFVFLAFEILLGRFVGLRLLEYIRFRSLFTHSEREE